MRTCLTIAAIALSPFMVASAEGVQLKPGLWTYEIYTEIEAVGRNTETVSSCIDEDGASRSEVEFAARLVQVIQSPDCKVSHDVEFEDEDDTFYFGADCTSQQSGYLRYVVKHSPTEFKAEGRGMASTLAAYKSMTGKYVGACTQ